jgi:hypothetical protein
MATTIRHSSAFKPITVAERSDISIDNWDRVQNFSVAVNQPQEKLYELGRLDKMATDKDKLEVSVSITQYEYGTLDSYLQLIGESAMPSGGIDLEDFDTTRVDFISPGKTEYAGTLEQTLWCERLSVDSIGLNINADERLERTFELSGNYCKIAREGNMYVIFKSEDVGSGVSGSHDIVLSDPAPVVNPNVAGEYILKVYRIRAGVATELTETTDYTWTNGTTTLNIISALASDNYRIWYTSDSYGTSGDPQVLNDADDYYLGAENVTVTIDDGTNDAVELDKLTSLAISATLNRSGEGAIGTSENLFNDVESYDVSVALGGFIKNYPIQEALMTQAGQSWGIINYSDMNSVSILVKVYETSAKSTFVIGYLVTGCELSDDSPADYTANEFGSTTVTLNSDNLKISTTESDIAIA